MTNISHGQHQEACQRVFRSSCCRQGKQPLLLLQRGGLEGVGLGSTRVEDGGLAVQLEAQGDGPGPVAELLLPGTGLRAVGISGHLQEILPCGSPILCIHTFQRRVTISSDEPMIGEVCTALADEEVDSTFASPARQNN